MPKEPVRLDINSNDPLAHSHTHEPGSGHSHDQGPSTLPHGHSHVPGGEHSHDGDHGLLSRVMQLVGLGHSHSYGEAARDSALRTSELGIRTVKITAAVLLITAALQVTVVFFTGSVALLADTVHNFSDALTAVPLWMAFSVGRRANNRRYTYGYSRAEDLAGAVVVGMILFSSLEIFRQAYDHIVHPQPIQHLGWVIAAAIIGFLGNEIAAVLRLRVGRQIGSAALVADGLHAQTDGFTSLGVLFGAIGVWLGFPLADPILALIIGAVILVIVAQSARDMWYRLMDAVDPAISAKFEATARAVPGVIDIHDLRVRWTGHRQRGELHVGVDHQITTASSHRIAEEVRHALLHSLPELTDVTVHVDPCKDGSADEYHELTAHHFQSDPARADGAAAGQAAGSDFAAILRPVEGIQIIDDISGQFGVDTLEGRIGPLLQGVASRAHFIEMPRGLYLYEHPHDTEAVIFTVRGSWVLCTAGQRHVMKPGSLFWFGPKIAAGYEVPFEEPALILIFKGERGWNPDTFIDYLKNTLQPSLMQERQSGVRFLIGELPADHPARQFAASLRQEQA